MKCKNCKIEHNGTYGSGKFCSRSCAGERNHSKETINKIKESLTKYNERINRIKTTKICQICKEERLVCKSNIKKTCGKKECISKMKSNTQIERILSGQINKTNTKPEREFRKYLDENKIKYKFQYKIERYLVDFYLPDTNLIIEVYGDYWHTNPKFYNEPKSKAQKFNAVRDKLKIKYLKLKGYKIKIIWEDDIKNKKFPTMPI